MNKLHHKSFSLLAIMFFSLSNTYAQANTKQTTNENVNETTKQTAKENLKNMSCKQFLLIEDDLKPTYIKEGLVEMKSQNAKGYIVEENIQEKIKPVIVEECKKAPKESFLEKLKGSYSKEKDKVESSF